MPQVVRRERRVVLARSCGTPLALPVHTRRGREGETAHGRGQLRRPGTRRTEISAHPVFPQRGEAVTFHRLASGKVTTTTQTIPRATGSIPYAWTGSGHWIADVGDSGRTIRLEDRSLWLVSSFDRFTARFWLVVDNITVLHDFGDHYRLVNTSQGEKIDVTYLGRG